MGIRLMLSVCGVVAGSAFGQSAGVELLQSMYPGVRTLARSGHTVIVNGVGMTAGETPRAAAEAWLEQHGEVFGEGSMDVEPAWAAACMEGRLTVFAFRQRMEGYAVDGGLLRVVVRNGKVPRVVHVGGTLANTPEQGRGEMQVSGGMAGLMAAAMGLGVVRGEAELVVLRWEGEREDRWAWKVRVSPEEAPGESRAVYVDIVTGQVLKVNEEFAHGHRDISGTVKGYGTPINMLPDRPGNGPVLMGLPLVRVNNSLGGTWYTDWNGNYVIVMSGSGQTPTLTSLLGYTVAEAGAHMFVYDDNAGISPPRPWALSASAGPVTNPASNVAIQMPIMTGVDGGVAQVNAAVNAHRAYDFVMSRVAFETPILEGPLRVRVNENTIWSNVGVFLTSEDGYPTIKVVKKHVIVGQFTMWNACYSGGLFLHEYGHYVQHVLGLLLSNPTSFREGGADAFQAMVNDDPVIGKEMFLREDNSINNWRDDPTGLGINCQYPITSSTPNPCSCGAHASGQLLSGVWWDVRKQLVATLGDGPGVAAARDLFVAWMLITIGGEDECNPAGCHTLEEVLTVDDDDANLGNGTPNDTDILAGFALHNIGGECEF